MPKCYKHVTFLSSAHFMIPGVTNAIRSILKGKQEINISKKAINLHTNIKIFIKPIKIKLNGVFFLHKKQCFN